MGIHSSMPTEPVSSHQVKGLVRFVFRIMGISGGLKMFGFSYLGWFRKFLYASKRVERGGVVLGLLTGYMQCWPLSAFGQPYIEVLLVSVSRVFPIVGPFLGRCRVFFFFFFFFKGYL